MPADAARPGRRGAGRPKGKNRDAMLAKILVVARRHFAEKGYAQTTFLGIARDADISHTAIYSYYESKADLYLATLIATQQRFLPDFIKAMEETSTLRERFQRLMALSATAHAEDDSIIGFLSAVPIEMRRHPELNTTLLQQNDAAFGTMAAMFDEAKRSGELATNASTINLVSAFFGGTIGVALFEYGIQVTSLTEAMNVFFDMLDGDIYTAD
ncbi:putative transcriptional regulatory protein [Sterolibacterium denitrificans]|uniref:Transcriptional regulatory protein n=1 Tax=Sterolibacterium denitrificans TaxID=157592 RepID=A0A7Z7MVD2_9PROT|nr:TetR/AcrR family transcriptional regulator [Sterolibacterium denitrificans]SMB25050.1 putative transcriptional regulatory protein [Sterolibacterium denitrificans]